MEENMKKRRNIAGGLILILLGAFFIYWQLAPDKFTSWFDDYFSWPYYIIGTGLVFILISIVTGTGGLAVPGSIIGGIGGILFYQNLTGDWVSWAYIWVLIPGFVGLECFSAVSFPRICVVNAGQGFHVCDQCRHCAGALGSVSFRCDRDEYGLGSDPDRAGYICVDHCFHA